jgi:hypothetical protein
LESDAGSEPCTSEYKRDHTQVSLDEFHAITSESSDKDEIAEVGILSCKLLLLRRALFLCALLLLFLATTCALALLVARVRDDQLNMPVTGEYTCGSVVK